MERGGNERGVRGVRGVREWGGETEREGGEGER
jgi:hypothetical protein